MTKEKMRKMRKMRRQRYESKRMRRSLASCELACESVVAAARNDRQERANRGKRRKEKKSVIDGGVCEEGCEHPADRCRPGSKGKERAATSNHDARTHRTNEGGEGECVEKLKEVWARKKKEREETG